MFDPVSLLVFTGGLCFWQGAFNLYDEYKERKRRKAWQRKHDKWVKEWYEPYLEQHRKEREEVEKKWEEEDRRFREMMKGYTESIPTKRRGVGACCLRRIDDESK